MVTINKILPLLNLYFDNVEAKVVQIVKESQKIRSNYGFFQFFFANTLGVPGKGLYSELFLNLSTYIVPFLLRNTNNKELY